MMNWFKHYANADKDSRLQRLKTDYGFWGMGVYWSILERVMCYGEGCYPRNELMGLKQNRRDTGVIKAVLDRYDLFLTDEFGMVRCIKTVQQSGTFVPENDKNVHECGTKVPTLYINSNAEEKQKVIDNKEDNQKSLAHTHVKEKREEKKREEENTFLNPPCEGDAVDKIQVDELTRPCGTASSSTCQLVPSSTESVIHELRTNRIWQEAVCMNSGYGALLMRHFNRAVDIFLQHVRAGADEVELTDRRRAMNYFRNFTRLSHPAGRALKEELEKMQVDELTRYEWPCGTSNVGANRCVRPETSSNTNQGGYTDPPLQAAEGEKQVPASPFEDPPGPNGERSYHGGRLLPPDAPPRPSPQAEWDEAEEKWLILN